MSKYELLWRYIKDNKKDKYILSFDEINKILEFKLDHSFLNYKKELYEYGYSVKKISLAKKEVIIERNI